MGGRLGHGSLLFLLRHPTCRAELFRVFPVWLISLVRLTRCGRLSVKRLVPTLNWLFVSKRLRKYSQVANNSITLPDYFSNRFHDSKNILMTISALVILLFFSIYVGSCFATCGKLFATLFGLDYATMMVLGALIVFLYTFVGGYLSVCTTDLIQGSIMICALVVVLLAPSQLLVESTIRLHSCNRFLASFRAPRSQRLSWTKLASR